MDGFKLRCRLCRCVVATDDQLINIHGLQLQDDACSSSKSLWYVSPETCRLPWIQAAVNRASWTKGKLTCPKCDGRLGSFDFITTPRCVCGMYTIPAVHILKNRVDEVRRISSLPLSKSSSSLRRNLSGVIDVLSEARGTKDDGVGQGDTFPPLLLVQKTELSCDISRNSSNGKATTSLSSVFLPNARNGQPDHSDVNKPEIHSIHPTEDYFDQTYFMNKEGCDVEICSSGRKVVHSKNGEDLNNHENMAESCVRTCERGNVIRRKIKQKRPTTDQGIEVSFQEEVTLKEGSNRFNSLSNEESLFEEEEEDCVLEEHVCPVCLDLLLNPHSCRPCRHVFCESCLRQLAQKSSNSLSFCCPMCRNMIDHCSPEKGLTQTIKSVYSELYKTRKMSESKYLSHRFPLPKSTRSRTAVNEERLASVLFRHYRRGHLYWEATQVWMRCVTFFGAVILLLLVLCVSYAI